MIAPCSSLFTVNPQSVIFEARSTMVHLYHITTLCLRESLLDIKSRFFTFSTVTNYCCSFFCDYKNTTLEVFKWVWRMKPHPAVTLSWSCSKSHHHQNLCEVFLAFRQIQQGFCLVIWGFLPLSLVARSDDGRSMTKHWLRGLCACP